MRPLLRLLLFLVLGSYLFSHHGLFPRENSWPLYSLGGRELLNRVPGIANGAVDLKGDPRLDVRLGGIYSLEAIAESKDFHWPTMEVLSAYIREHSWEQQVGPITRIDIQAILTVLGRRDRKYESWDQRINLFIAKLSRVDLSTASLVKANLRRADLSFANLSGAFLGGANLLMADLLGADLSGADLRSATLIEARNLTQEQIERAKGSAATKLPADLHMSESWTKLK